MANVFDIAKYILYKNGSMTTMKLQKLVYYSQVWTLVWNKKPLFPQRIEAWENGPVVRELFNMHKGDYIISKDTLQRGDFSKLTKIEIDTINRMLAYYGNKSPEELIQLTHSETPWMNAREGCSANVKCNKVISHESILDYYQNKPPKNNGLEEEIWFILNKYDDAFKALANI